MDSNSIDLQGSRIAAISRDADGTVHIRFQPAYIVRIMTGSVERTRWWQNGELTLQQASLQGADGLSLPAECLGGDIRDNVFTYRNMVPLPLEGRGNVGVELRLLGVDQPVVATGSALRAVMDDVPKYIEHIRPD